MSPQPPRRPPEPIQAAGELPGGRLHAGDTIAIAGKILTMIARPGREAILINDQEQPE